MGEILDWRRAIEKRNNFRGTIVFTNGVFDIIHRGHIDYLKAARQFGDMLIVGVNSDASARTLGKGEGRPFNNEQDRAYILANLSMVDVVVIFDQPTPKELIEALQPEVLVKGGDYELDKIVGRDTIEARGGKVISIPLTPGKSTTNLINKILQFRK